MRWDSMASRLCTKFQSPQNRGEASNILFALTTAIVAIGFNPLKIGARLQMTI